MGVGQIFLVILIVEANILLHVVFCCIHRLGNKLDKIEYALLQTTIPPLIFISLNVINLVIDGLTFVEISKNLDFKAYYVISPNFDSSLYWSCFITSKVKVVSIYIHVSVCIYNKQIKHGCQNHQLNRKNKILKLFKHFISLM